MLAIFGFDDGLSYKSGRKSQKGIARVHFVLLQVVAKIFW
jgi:hypothetical protein